MKNLAPGSLVWYGNQIRIVVHVHGNVAHLFTPDNSTQVANTHELYRCHNLEISCGRSSPGTVLRHPTDGLFVVQSMKPLTARCIASENLALIGVLVGIKGVNMEAKSFNSCGGVSRLKKKPVADTFDDDDDDDDDELSEYADYSIDQFAVVHPADLLK